MGNTQIKIHISNGTKTPMIAYYSKDPINDKKKAKYVKIPAKSYIACSAREPMYVIVYYEDGDHVTDSAYVNSHHSVLFTDAGKVLLSYAETISAE
ncbi:hypothetical protein COCON_G00138110 [Conger conger]|uniref:Uncharacterized protein n=1 Tax=Conger conger TaxID=82655 RepID=A0A9Q1DFD8_CONCO|nr:hypothetical protein COCON_G00138110 [Conger conger]